MAWGKHWEWRRFGTLRPEDRARIEQLPRKFGPDDRGRDETDLYLWSHGCRKNIKLRGNELKVKELLLVQEGGWEYWEEDIAKTFSFPLAEAAVAALESALGVKLPRSVPPDPYSSPSALQRLLTALDPWIIIVQVKKHRVQHVVHAANAEVAVELADIFEPMRVSSIGIEAEEGDEPAKLAAARQTLSSLTLGSPLKVMAYDQFIDVIGAAHARIVAAPGSPPSTS